MVGPVWEKVKSLWREEFLLLKEQVKAEAGSFPSEPHVGQQGPGLQEAEGPGGPGSSTSPLRTCVDVGSPVTISPQSLYQWTKLSVLSKWQCNS